MHSYMIISVEDQQKAAQYTLGYLVNVGILNEDEEYRYWRRLRAAFGRMDMADDSDVDEKCAEFLSIINEINSLFINEFGKSNQAEA